MKQGGILVGGMAVLAVAACGGNQAELSIRAIPGKLAQGEQPVPFRIAEARGQLALGNAGLALESFRKALRDDPASVDALAGIATCYDLMGRFDLSRRHYEAALALAPADTQLLAALAKSLDLQGRRAEAASVRLEITERLAAANAASQATAPAQPVAAKPQVGNVQPDTPDVHQAELIAPEPAVQQLASMLQPPVQAPVAAAPAVLPAVPKAAVASPAPVAIAAEPLEVTRLESGAIRLDLPVALPEAPPVQPGRSVTIKLPPPRSASAAVVDARPTPFAVEPAVAIADAKDIKPVLAARLRAPARSPAPREVRAERTGPRIERLSMGEVALVTVSGPRWRSEPVSQTARSATVRFVPVRQATDWAEVRLLNAARVHRLAARTRAWLAGRGWRGVSIGDAPATRTRSIIFYPAGQRSAARRLSAQFGFAIAPRRDVQQVTVLLGRDSIRIAGARAKT